MLKNHSGTETPVLCFFRGSKEEKKKGNKKEKLRIFSESLFEESLRLK